MGNFKHDLLDGKKALQISAFYSTLQQDSISVKVVTE